MEKVRSIRFNFIMNSILTASKILFPLISYPYVARILQPSGTGAVAFANSVVLYFSMFAQLGIPTYGIRACAKVREDKEELTRTVQEILCINLITCLLVYAAFGLSLSLVPRFREEKQLFVVMGSMILFNAIGVEWLYQGLEQYQYITIRSILFKLIGVAAMFLLIHEKEDYVVYGGIMVLASVGSNLLNFINLRKIIDCHPVGGYHLLRHLKPVSIFFAMSVATTVYTNMDSVMLGFMKGTEENGYYDAAVKVKNMLVNFVISLGTVLMPRVSYYIEMGKKEEFDRISRKALHFVMLLAFPLCIYFILFARPVILLVSGQLYEASTVPMQLIMPTLILIGLTNIMGIQMLVPMGREKQVLYSEIAGAATNLAVNMALIPRFGASGAAIGTLAAETVVLVVQLIVLRGKIFSALREIPYLKMFIALLCATGLARWVPAAGMESFMVLLISSVLFFGGYVLVLLLTRERLAVELIGGICSLTKSKRRRKEN